MLDAAERAIIFASAMIEAAIIVAAGLAYAGLVLWIAAQVLR